MLREFGRDRFALWGKLNVYIADSKVYLSLLAPIKPL